MFDIDVWQEIFSTIRKNKLRTFLTGFSVAWGIFMLMILLGSGNGLQNGVKQEFASNAVNAMWIWTGETSMPYKGMKTGRPIHFDNRDYTFLKNKVSGLDEVSSRFFLPGDTNYAYGNEYGSFTTITCHPALKDVENIKLNKGRFINHKDITDYRKSIVIGKEIAKALFKEENPIGKYLKVNDVPFKVVGVCHDEDNRNDRTAYMPVSTAQRIFNGGNRVHSFAVTTKMVTSEKQAEAITSEVREALAQRHKFNPDDKRAMGAFNMLTEYLRTMKIFQGIKIFVWVIGIGTLIAGIVGVSNIMLILVKERTREIGVRKALGASPRSVIGLILMESILITTVAGYIGLTMGVGIMEVVNYGLEQAFASGGGDGIFFRNPTVDFGTAITATLILILSGAIAGYIPAKKAASVKPIEALRDE